MVILCCSFVLAGENVSFEKVNVTRGISIRSDEISQNSPYVAISPSSFIMGSVVNDTKQNWYFVKNPSNGRMTIYVGGGYGRNYTDEQASLWLDGNIHFTSAPFYSTAGILKSTGVEGKLTIDTTNYCTMENITALKSQIASLNATLQSYELRLQALEKKKK
jgi:hypothetical protein